MIWTALLQLHEQLRAADGDNAQLCNCATVTLDDFSPVTPAAHLPTVNLSERGDPKVFHLELRTAKQNAGPLLLTFSRAFDFSLPENHALMQTHATELALYLPYALLPWFARQQERGFAISHFAQTLDGRIAASSGDSKWIGNAENLSHAHKMRALCDAILVGTTTLRADQPQLSVRHVKGKNPLRIILGNNCHEADIASDNTGPLLWINTARSSKGLDQLTLTARDGKIDCVDIMTALYDRGIFSVYIEGGATTTSHFMQSSALDQVQVHLSPKILGSGITGFNFNGAKNMDNAVNFRNPRFITIGNEVMFVGEVFR